jgi:hypothetical protein
MNTNATLTQQDENRYFTLRADGLDHDAAVDQISKENSGSDNNRTEWAPESKVAR